MMNDSMHNSTDKTETEDLDEGHVMSVDSGNNASMMQSTVLTDLGLIYMLQQQHQGIGGEAAMMLSPGSLPLLMSSCQVMALHPGVSQQFVSCSSAGTSPSSLARSPLLSHDGIVWHPANADDQLPDSFEDEHNQGTSFSQQQPQGIGGPSHPASPALRNPMIVQRNNHQQLTVNGGVAGYSSGYSVATPVSTIGHSSGFVVSVPPKVVMTPPKPSLVAPKKPLTPYMKFSKSIWQHVKNANPSMSVCEVGASIGRLWREMSDTDKQKYNDEFQREKAVYEIELQNYLRATGLQVSDLTRSKKKDPRDRSKLSTNLVVSPKENFTKNIVVPPVLHGSPVTSAAVHDADAEGARLPHISQMWSGHSTAQQSPAIQNVLKTVCNPFDSTQLKGVELCSRLQQELDANLCPAEMSSGVPWTWIKAVEPTVPSRSFPLDVLDTSQSAYVQQDQGSLNVLTMPLEQQRSVDMFSSDGLEPGEVIVEGIEQSPMMKVSASQSNSTASAHNMYNSYAVNPWSQYKLPSGGLKTGEAIFDREQILKTELIHLRGSLSEKTKEVEQLIKELQMAYALIGKLQNQDISQSQLQLHFSEESGLLQFGTQDISLGGLEPGEQLHIPSLSDTDKQLITTNTEIRETIAVEGRESELKNVESGECVLEKLGYKQEWNYDMKVGMIESDRQRVAASRLAKDPEGVGVSKQEVEFCELVNSNSVLQEFSNTLQCSIPSSEEVNPVFSVQEEVFDNLQIAQELTNQVTSENKEIVNELREAAAPQQDNVVDGQQEFVYQQQEYLLLKECVAKEEHASEKQMMWSESETKRLEDNAGCQGDPKMEVVSCTKKNTVAEDPKFSTKSTSKISSDVKGTNVTEDLKL